MSNILYNPKAQHDLDDFMMGFASPLHRGLLPRYRNKPGDANVFDTFRHLPHYRVDSYWLKKPKSTNEKRQYAAATVDNDNASAQVTVRAKRHAHNLPNAWDDYYQTFQRTWKKKKVRKQWQANLSL
jgi:hypothetical protein